MLAATPLTAVLGSGPDPGNPDAMRAYVRSCCHAGLAVLFIAPGTKEPVDLRTMVRRNRDDAAARDAARAAGRADAARVRAPSGLHLATADADVALGYLSRYVGGAYSGQPVNLAVEVGRSRLVVVDCDTAEQVAEFLALSGADPDTPPTVRSPGKQAPDGTWLHKDGGHYYFTLPDGVTLPTDMGSINLGDTGFAVLWHDRYVLIPPSVRAEGPYELAGRDYELPDWLHEAITIRSAARAARVAMHRSAGFGDELLGRVNERMAQISWGSILAEASSGDGAWVEVAAADACECPMYTAPGDHASPKSATAHDVGCTLGLWDSDTNAPLHIWTDSPGEPFESWMATSGQRTLTKLRALALIRHSGNMSATMDELGIEHGEGIQLDAEYNIANLREPIPEPVASPAGEFDFDMAGSTPLIDLPDQPGDVCDVCGEQTTTANARFDEDGRLWHLPVNGEAHLTSARPADAEDTAFPTAGHIDSTTGLYIPLNKAMPQIAPFDFWRDYPPPEFLVEGLIEHGGLSCLFGPSGVGKSTVALDIACHVATGRPWHGRAVMKTKVLYLPGEGRAGVVQRVLAWLNARGMDSIPDLLLGNTIIKLGASAQSWGELADQIARREIKLVIFDTYARMSSGNDENSATDANLAISRFDAVRDLASAGVMLIHHTGWAAVERLRGSSALNAALDSEILVAEGRDDVPSVNGHPARSIRVRATKQKNGELDRREIALLMTHTERAPLITGPTGTVDPMGGPILIAPPLPEPVIETAIRIYQYALRFPNQGVTRTDIARGVRPDPYTANLRDPERAWKAKVGEAVDRALTEGIDLLATLTGAVGGARYVAAPDADPAQARAFAAQQALTE